MICPSTTCKLRANLGKFDWAFLIFRVKIEHAAGYENCFEIFHR